MITLPVNTPDDADLTAGTPAALFRPALALVAHGDTGESWERGMRAFFEGMVNCVNVTQSNNVWNLVDKAVALGLRAAADGRTDAAEAFKVAWEEYERLAAAPVGEPVKGQPPVVIRKRRGVVAILTDLLGKDKSATKNS